jgi:SAM-dependent methyltransferase
MTTPQSSLKNNVRDLLLKPAVKNVLEIIPVIRRIYPGVYRTHPIDRFYGIDTGGAVYIESAHPSVPSELVAYIGSQPSIVRQAVVALGDIRDYIFVDLGCGKGRATAVASEFPFRAVTGVELSSELAATARTNTAAIAKRFSDRCKVTIADANILDYPLPEGPVVFFNYHGFGAELMQKLVSRCEAALAVGKIPHIFFVYYNPVHSEAFDASPAFERFYAEQVPYDKSEIGFGPDRHDVVAIWQSIQGARPTPHKGADRKIIRTNPMRAGLP